MIAITDETTDLKSGWYVVSGNVTIGNRITVEGDVHLILADDSHLNATNGINVAEGSSFTVYAQSTGEYMGKLTATTDDANRSGIGGVRNNDGGTITINGGKVVANGGNGGAGIGGGGSGDGGTVTISGGTVTAVGICGAGIGGGYEGDGGTVIITGGVVDAQGIFGGAGIGGGYEGNGAAVTISGGTVTSTDGGDGSKGIGRGAYGDNDGTLDITNAIVFASSATAADGDKGRKNAVLVDGGTIGFCGGDTVTLNGDYVIPATKALTIPSNITLVLESGTIVNNGSITNNGTIINDGAIINGGVIANNGAIVNNGAITGSSIYGSGTITENNVPYIDAGDGAKKADNVTVITGFTDTLGEGWYIVHGDFSVASLITVEGDVNLILSDGCDFTANKGINVTGESNSLTIYAQSTGENMGKLTAGGSESDSNQAGIGGGGTVTINGGTVDAQGGDSGAGIGGGANGAGGTVTINGGTVTATGGGNGAGIGGGYNSNGGTVEISGGTVTATGGGSGGKGIGRGNEGMNDGTLNITNAIVFASSATEGETQAGRTNAVLVIGDETTFYGIDNTVTLNGDYVIPADKTLTIGIGKTLVLESGSLIVIEGGMITGAIEGAGSLTGNGTLTNNGSVAISLATVTDTGPYTYTGSEITPDFIVKIAGTPLTEDDYSIKPLSGNINAGPIGYTITGIDNYAGEKTGSFTISPKDITNAEVTVTSGTYTYDGNEQRPGVESVMLDAAPISDADYDVAYEANIDVGTATVNVSSKGNYTGTASGTFEIGEKELTVIDIAFEGKTYDGTTDETIIGTPKLNGVVDGDKDPEFVNLNSTAVSYAFTNKDAETNTVKRTGDYSLSGTRADNYTLTQPATLFSATIIKATPTIDTEPTASNIYKGDLLSASTLSGGVASVLGTFRWTDGTATPDETNSFSATFMPSDENSYNPATTQATVTVLDRDALGTIIASANGAKTNAEVGDAHGQYTQEQINAFALQITAVQNIYDTLAANNTQQAIDDAAETLKEAIKSFEGASNDVSVEELAAWIQTATDKMKGATYGDRNGDYAPEQEATLLNAIDAAKVVATNPNRTPAKVSQAITDLQTAIANFDDTLVTVVYGNLTDLIDLCNPLHNNAVEGDGDGHYKLGSKTAFKAAIETAELIAGNNHLSQATVDGAIDALQAALNKFSAEKIGVNRDILEGLIEQAQEKVSLAVPGDKNGDYPETAIADLDVAAEAALTTANILNVTQEAVNEAEDALRTAIEAFNAAKIVVDFDALDVKIAEAKLIGRGSYTSDTWNALQTAITDAETVRGTQYVTQAATDNALSALDSAISGLRHIYIPPPENNNNNNYNDKNDNAAKPAEPPAKIPGGNEAATPADKPPVSNPDGSVTLPGGGTVTTPGGEKITVSSGSSIDTSGIITVGDGGGKVENGGVTVAIPGGSVVTPDGELSFPQGGGGSITLGSGLTFNTPEGAAIVFDEDSPLGYRVEAENPFTDAKPEDWFYDDVMFAYGHGLIAGTDAAGSASSPDISLTRSMMTTIIYRVTGSPDASGLSNPFPDVANGIWYADAVKWAAANKVVEGHDGRFDPDASITRQDLAVMLLRFAEYKGLELPEIRAYAVFADDKDVSDYARAAVEALYKAGIISGKPGNRLDPKGTATRAEAAAMQRRFLESAGK